MIKLEAPGGQEAAALWKLSTLLAFLALVGLLGGCDLFGAQPKTAVINTRDVITKCTEGIRAVTEVQKQFADRQTRLKAQEETISKLRQSPAMADPKSGKKEELRTLVQKYVADSQQLRKDVSEVEAAKFKPIVDRINKALAEYAKEHGLVSVQDKNGFAYINPSIDITDAIIKKVDETK